MKHTEMNYGIQIVLSTSVTFSNTGINIAGKLRSMEMQLNPCQITKLATICGLAVADTTATDATVTATDSDCKKLQSDYRK